MIKNYVLETANAPGTSTTFNLGGAATDRFSFAGAGFTNGQLCYYFMDDGAQFEWGIATFNTGSPNTLSRTTVLGNSAGLTTRLNFTGTTDVYNEIPAEKSVYVDSTGKVSVPGRTDGTPAASGNIGELIESFVSAQTTTVTMTIAAPGVVAWPSHGLKTGATVLFTTTGALPSGITATTNYFAIVVDSGHIQLATTAANALAGTAITTSGSQSGTHTGFADAFMTTATAQDVMAVSLPAGDWEIEGVVGFNAGGSTVLTIAQGWISTVSATLPTPPNLGSYAQWIGSFTGGGPHMAVGPRVINSSGATTVYLSVRAAFTTSTLTAVGGLRARRTS